MIIMKMDLRNKFAEDNEIKCQEHDVNYHCLNHAFFNNVTFFKLHFPDCMCIWKSTYSGQTFEDDVSYLYSHLKEQSVISLRQRLIFLVFKHTYQLELHLFQWLASNEEKKNILKACIWNLFYYIDWHFPLLTSSSASAGSSLPFIWWDKE